MTSNGSMNASSVSSTVSSSSSSPSSPSGRDASLAAAEVTVQAVVLVAALLSNALVLLALVRQIRRKPASRMYRLMYHLSIADLLVAIFNILPQLAWDITFRFSGPDFVCRLVKFGQVFPLYLSSFVLTAMALDRARVTGVEGNPSGDAVGAVASGKGDIRSLMLLIKTSWILSFFFSVPQLFIFTLRTVSDDGTKDCWADFAGSKSVEKIYIVTFLAVVFFCPFLVITASYCVVTHRVWSYSRRTQTKGVINPREDGLSGGNKQLIGIIRREETPRGQRSISKKSANNVCASPPPSPQLLTRAKRKSLAMAATVSVCFAVCWLPWCVAMLLLAFEVGGGPTHPVLVILALLASLNSTTNPWIYLCFSSAVLQQVKHLLGMRTSVSDGDSVGAGDADRLAGQHWPPLRSRLHFHGGSAGGGGERGKSGEGDKKASCEMPSSIN